MLLDRKRINKWSKRVALAMAIVFGLSFVLLGCRQRHGRQLVRSVEQSGRRLGQQRHQRRAGRQDQGVPGPAGDRSQQLRRTGRYRDPVPAAPATARGRHVLRAGHQDQGRSEATSTSQLGGDLHGSHASPTTQSAIRVLNQLTTLDPTNAQAFLQLGIAQRNVGNTNAAILAWNQYITLDPNSDMAKTVKAQIDQLTAAGSTTTTRGPAAPPGRPPRSRRRRPRARGPSSMSRTTRLPARLHRAGSLGVRAVDKSRW